MLGYQTKTRNRAAAIPAHNTGLENTSASPSTSQQGCSLSNEHPFSIAGSQQPAAPTPGCQQSHPQAGAWAGLEEPGAQGAGSPPHDTRRMIFSARTAHPPPGQGEPSTGLSPTRALIWKSPFRVTCASPPRTQRAGQGPCSEPVAAPTSLRFVLQPPQGSGGLARGTAAPQG